MKVYYTEIYINEFKFNAKIEYEYREEKSRIRFGKGFITAYDDIIEIFYFFIQIDNQWVELPEIPQLDTEIKQAILRKYYG